MAESPTYRYLNLELAWPAFALEPTVEISAAGALRLVELPRLDTDATGPLPPLPGFEGPAGVGVDSCGNIYVADLARHRILRVDACDGGITPLPCISGPGAEPGQLNSPRGLMVGRRDTLYVADTGNRRIQLFDLATGQLRGLWESGFLQPWDLAQDASGKVYVADPGTGGDRLNPWQGGRVVRLLPSGVIDPAWSLQAPLPGAPVSVAVTLMTPSDPLSARLLVLDRQPRQLLVYRLDGSPDAEATALWSSIPGAVKVPGALHASSTGRVYVADATGRVLVFDARGRLLGTASGADAVAGVALDCDGRLVVNPGAGSAVRRALGLPSFAGCGTFLAGPFEADTEPTRWQRLELEVDPVPEGAHFRLWTLTTRDAASPGAVPVACDGTSATVVVEPDTIEPTPLGTWRALPWDASQSLILNQPGKFLWIAGMLQGDGDSTPAIRQMRLVHDETGWLRYLPALYARNDASRVFLERALAVFETMFNRERDLIQDLQRLFDPWAAPDEPLGSWLEWLADWVGTELDESWTDSKRRETVARAFAVFGRRGTRATLRHLVELYTGATIHLEEATARGGLWTLGGPGAALGFDTALPALHPSGAVLRATAPVNRSTLENEDPRGRPAFEDQAHRFTVYAYGAHVLNHEALERVRGVVAREKPAHTTFHLCVIEPAMRVGHQARLGVDTIVGGPPRGGAFDPGRRLGVDSVLPEDQRREQHGTMVGERLSVTSTAG